MAQRKWMFWHWLSQVVEMMASQMLVMHKVHRPALIRLVGNRQRLWLSPNQPFPGFYPQIELQRPIDPVYPFVIPAKALDVAQVQKA